MQWQMFGLKRFRTVAQYQWQNSQQPKQVAHEGNGINVDTDTEMPNKAMHAGERGGCRHHKKQCSESRWLSHLESFSGHGKSAVYGGLSISLIIAAV